MTQQRTLEEIQADMEKEVGALNPEADDEVREEETEQEQETEGGEVESEEEEESGPDAEEALLHGFKPYDEYIADGGDPDMYRGPKAFVQYQKLKDEERAKVDKANSRVESLVDEVERLSKMMVEDRKAQKERYKQELEDRLKQQKEDLDVDGFERTKDELAKLGTETEEEPSPKPRQEHPVIATFRETNPVFDHASDKFDSEVNEWVEQRVNTRLTKLAQSGTELTERALKKALEEEHERVKRAFPEKFEAPRKGKRRQAPATAEAQPGKGGKPSGKLDANAQAVYNSMVANGRKAAAEEFKRNMLEA